MPALFVHPIERTTHQIALFLDELRLSGLTQGEAHILALLAQSSPASVAELHRRLAHKRSTLTSILDRLAQRRLITRKVREADRRSFVIALTAKGQRVADRILRRLTKLERGVVRRVSGADIRGFNKVVAVLVDEISKWLKKPRH